MHRRIVFCAAVALLSACATVAPPPTWAPASNEREHEYLPFLEPGSASLTGQAFLAQRNGQVVHAAGRVVTLDPATTTGTEWWRKAGAFWVQRGQVPPSPAFLKARRTTTADSTGRFRFTDLPAGRYYLQTSVTWEAGGYLPTQGGLVGRLVDVQAGKATEVVLNAFAEP